MEYAMRSGFQNRIAPILAGGEQCPPSHSFGPFVRTCYLLHYVLDGKGVFKNERGEYTVTRGKYFLIRPGEITTYTADAETPWKYLWIHFTAENDERLIRAADVGDVSREPFHELYSHIERSFSSWNGGTEEYVSSVLYRALAEILSETTSGALYVERAEAYIRASYMSDITVEKIAALLSLDRRYLWRIFKEKTGVSIKEYITRQRLKSAAALLKDGRGVFESALLCGYGDASNFSKAFKKRYGVWPGEFAKNNKTSQKN